jgi:hypothetical protein
MDYDSVDGSRRMGLLTASMTNKPSTMAIAFTAILLLRLFIRLPA